MKTIILAAIFFSSFTASADIVASVGVGKGALGEKGTPFERVAALGYEYRFPVGVFVRPEIGWFMDISGQGKSSLWAAPLVGVRSVSKMGPEMHVAFGPGYLQNPDDILGGHFQFSLEAGIGICDKHFCIDAIGKHLSSAGINRPNKGRDLFPMVQARYLF